MAPINIIKMDIEGAERLALSEMRMLSHKNPELKLILEVNLRFNVEDVAEVLHACGFSRFCLLENGISEINNFEGLPHIVPFIQRWSVNLLCEKAN